MAESIEHILGILGGDDLLIQEGYMDELPPAPRLPAPNQKEKTMTELTQEQRLEKYRDMMVEMALPLEQMATLKKEIVAHARETGEVVEVDGARTTITNPKKPRVKWDTKGLEGVLAMNPKLGALRTEYWAAPSVRIIVD